VANQITDNRTLVVNADSATGWVASASATLDTDVFIQGTGSIAEQITNTERYIMYNMGATQNWANNVFYIWINCGIVGLLAAKASGGFKIRFAGPTVSNYFEFNVGGNDSWPVAIAGGWVQFVVDIEATPSGTGGTPPATSAIQHVGYAAVTGGTMTKVADNTWIDEIRRLPDGTAGILVEGRNGGSTPWTFANMYTQLGVGAGTLKQGPAGTYLLNTSIQVGINDTTTHDFEDTNQTILWENQEWAPTDLYRLLALGNAGGSTRLVLGVKTGTGDDATGAQGVTFQAAAGGVRWAMDFDDANLNTIGFYGCTLNHMGDAQLDSSVVETIGCLFLDCTSVRQDNGRFQRCTIVDPDVLTNVPFLTTDDMTDVKFCNFQSNGVGHAIELTTPRVASQTSKGNIFSGYAAQGGTAGNRAIYNNTAGAVTISVTDGGGTPTYRDGTSASTVVQNAVTVSVVGLTRGTSVKVIALATVGSVTSGDVLFEGFANSSGQASFSHNYEGNLSVSVRARNQGIAVAAIQANTGGTVFVDETINANSSATSDMTLIPSTGSYTANDAYYFGAASTFLRLKIDISQAGSMGFVSGAAEYWNGSSWTTISGSPSILGEWITAITTLGLSTISWALPSGWATTTVNGITGLYWVRFRIASISPYTTQPLGRKVTLDTTRYLPFNQTNTITSTGLTVNAVWVPDTIAKFSQSD